MKLSADKDSWKATALIKRDAQHTHDGPEISGPASKKRKKDTKLWCKGKQGVEHQIEEYVDWTSYNPDGTIQKQYVSYKCANCGKKMWALPAKAKAQVNPKIAEQLALAEKWCQEGHLYDKETLDHWPYFQKVCVMCGKIKKH